MFDKLDEVKVVAKRQAVTNSSEVYVVINKATHLYSYTEEDNAFGRYVGCYSSEGFWTRYGN